MPSLWIWNSYLYFYSNYKYIYDLRIYRKINSIFIIFESISIIVFYILYNLVFTKKVEYNIIPLLGFIGALIGFFVHLFLSILDEYVLRKTNILNKSKVNFVKKNVLEEKSYVLNAVKDIENLENIDIPSSAHNSNNISFNDLNKYDSNTNAIRKPSIELSSSTSIKHIAEVNNVNKETNKSVYKSNVIDIINKINDNTNAKNLVKKFQKPSIKLFEYDYNKINDEFDTVEDNNIK